MGSRSDWETMRHACETLDELGRALRAARGLGAPHARPAVRVRRAARATAGIEVIIAGAGGAAHLPGMTAAKTIAAGARRAGRVEGALGAWTRCSRSCRCRRGSRSARSRSAAPAPSTPRCWRPRSWPGSRPEIVRRLEHYRRAQTGAVAGIARPSRRLMQLGVLGGGQLARMLALAGPSAGRRLHRASTPRRTPAPGRSASLIVGAYDDPGGARRAGGGVRRRHVRVRERAGVVGRPAGVGGRGAPAAGRRSRSPRTGCTRSAVRASWASTRPDFRPRRLAGRPRRAWSCRPCSRRGGWATTARASWSRASAAGHRRRLRRAGRRAADRRAAGAVRPRAVGRSPCAAATARYGRYPLVENHHRDGILRLTLAPAPELTTDAAGAGRAATCGCCSSGSTTSACWRSSCSQVGDRLLANEIAPRVHNSGHWTIEGARTSQFENHLRAVARPAAGRPRRASAAARWST